MSKLMMFQARTAGRTFKTAACLQLGCRALPASFLSSYGVDLGFISQKHAFKSQFSPVRFHSDQLKSVYSPPLSSIPQARAALNSAISKQQQLQQHRILHRASRSTMTKTALVILVRLNYVGLNLLTYDFSLHAALAVGFPLVLLLLLLRVLLSLMCLYSCEGSASSLLYSMFVYCDLYCCII